MHGRGGHASTPHWATDPVPVACEIVLALQSMITRTVDAFDPGRAHRRPAQRRHDQQRDPRDGPPGGARCAPSTRAHPARGVGAHPDRGRRHRRRPRLPGRRRRSSRATRSRSTTPPSRTFVAGVAPRRWSVERRLVRHAGAGHGGRGLLLRAAARCPGAMVFLGVCPPEHADPFAAPACHSNRMVLHEDAMADRHRPARRGGHVVPGAAAAYQARLKQRSVRVPVAHSAQTPCSTSRVCSRQARVSGSLMRRTTCCRPPSKTR